MTKLTMTRIRVSLSWLVIVVFALRSLIPVGYMPDFTGGSSSSPTITICSGMDAEHMAMMGGKSKPSEAPSAHHHDAPCPYSVNAVFAFGGIYVPPAAPFVLFLAFLTLTALVFSPQRRFGNASPRGPPLFS